MELCVPITVQYKDVGWEAGNMDSNSGLFDLEQN